MENKRNLKNGTENESRENVGEVLTTASQWVEERSNLLAWVFIGLTAVVVGGLAFYKYVVKPRYTEASNENAKSVTYFMRGDYDKALNGDDEDCIGFEETANQYKHQQSGKLAALYAGLCYYQKGDYENAVKYVKRFSADDINIDPLANQLLGDLYVEMGEYEKAVQVYREAIKSGNELIAPHSLKKIGIVYLETGNKKSAKSVFEAIKNDYPQSFEAQDIDKFIAQTEY